LLSKWNLYKLCTFHKHAKGEGVEVSVDILDMGSWCALGDIEGIPRDLRLDKHIRFLIRLKSVTTDNIPVQCWHNACLRPDFILRCTLWIYFLTLIRQNLYPPIYTSHPGQQHWYHHTKIKPYIQNYHTTHHSLPSTFHH